MTAAHDNRADQAKPTGAGADRHDDEVMTDEEFRAELAWQKQAWKETERRLVDR